ncbi:hypothetical protein CPB83DRAFT_770291 [Crepidotus variabilis]|uniref:Protein CPL1-like domain-containing protein n=1 Tax=Crepidotus variabilis TaxID=179855 RepID=A0A9P6ECG9_9AGAR|nr:hypothetical protein CPB83DRAFT_770291 [Crepidotus variabilis]
MSTGSKDCGKSQFWYDKKSCCLDQGGPSNPPAPPKGNTCNNNSEYWHHEKSCCVPRCPAGWTYDSNKHECKCPTPPSPPSNPPHPSGHPSNNNNNNNNHNGHSYKKRSAKSRSEMCPLDLYACPIADVAGDFECLDTTQDLVSCGGCASEGKGQDCTKIDFVDNVACEAKACKVYTCESGYKPSVDGKLCQAV